VSVFKIDPGTGERMKLLGNSVGGRWRWVDPLSRSLSGREMRSLRVGPGVEHMRFASGLPLGRDYRRPHGDFRPYFLEEQFGRDHPPPVNHPELYYGFFGVTLSWQLMFLVIGSDPIRVFGGHDPGDGGEVSFAIAIPICTPWSSCVTWVGSPRWTQWWLVLFLIAYLRTPTKDSVP